MNQSGPGGGKNRFWVVEGTSTGNQAKLCEDEAARAGPNHVFTCDSLPKTTIRRCPKNIHFDTLSGAFWRPKLIPKRRRSTLERPMGRPGPIATACGPPPAAGGFGMIFPQATARPKSSKNGPGWGRKAVSASPAGIHRSHSYSLRSRKRHLQLG